MVSAGVSVGVKANGRKRLKKSWPNFHSVYQLQKCSVRA